jgi:hypothetical protein
VGRQIIDAVLIVAPRQKLTIWEKAHILTAARQRDRPGTHGQRMDQMDTLKNLGVDALS